MRELGPSALRASPNPSVVGRNDQPTPLTFTNDEVILVMQLFGIVPGMREHERHALLVVGKIHSDKAYRATILTLKKEDATRKITFIIVMKIMAAGAQLVAVLTQ